MVGMEGSSSLHKKVFSSRASKYGGSISEIQCFMNSDGKCQFVQTANVYSNRAFSLGKTVLLLLLHSSSVVLAL